MRSILVRLYDTWIREPRMIWQHYRPFFHNGERGRKDCNVFMADGRTMHGGMFDRLKGLISVYAVSKAQGKEFKINFTSPFRLERYLEPNNYDWSIGENELADSYPAARPLLLYGECYSPGRLLKNRRCEAHFYYGYDSLAAINDRYQTSYDWGELYHELFRPTTYLQQYIDNIARQLCNKYIAIHTRFLNLLGDKVETDINAELHAEQQQQLIKRIGNEIERVMKQHPDSRLLLASDSTRFVDYATRCFPTIYVVPGRISHIGTQQSDDGQVIKMFLDYYMLASAQKVYGIVADGMWASAFPEYAARIGGISFERIIV